MKNHGWHHFFSLVSAVFNFWLQGISQLLGWRDSDTVYPGAGSWEAPKPAFFEKLQQKLGSILLIPVCVEFRVGKRGSVFVPMSQFTKALDKLLLLLFNIYLFGFCSRSQLWYIGSLVVQTVSCYMWDLFLWLGIEPVPPALGTCGLIHWTTRIVPLDEFLMYLWGGWRSPCHTQVPSSSASPP